MATCRSADKKPHDNSTGLRLDLSSNHVPKPEKFVRDNTSVHGNWSRPYFQRRNWALREQSLHRADLRPEGRRGECDLLRSVVWHCPGLDERLVELDVHIR